MLESFIYKNHLGETIDFGKDGIFVNKNDLHDYSWSYSTVNSKISSFNKAVETRSIPVIISCSSEEEGIQKRNKLFEIVEKDVLAVQYGQIIIGDYYLKCYITKSKKQDYLSTKNYMKVTLTVATDYPFWIREVTTQFWKLGSEHETESDGVEYPYDYPFDYGSENKSRRITNVGFAAANVKLII